MKIWRIQPNQLFLLQPHLLFQQHFPQQPHFQPQLLLPQQPHHLEFQVKVSNFKKMYRNIYYSFPQGLKLLQQKLGIEAIPVMEKLVIVSTYGIPRVMFFMHI